MNQPAKPPENGETYDPDYFAPLFEIEDRHFWFQSRNLLFSNLVRQLTKNLCDGYRVLEVGCGTGSVLRTLEKTCEEGRVYGMDIFREGLQFARRRVNCPLIQGDIYQPAFGPIFDLIGLFDVLEHLPDDLAALKGLYALLAPGGALIMTVPAYPSLWSYFDEASHHMRRYEKEGLRSRLQEAGFTIEYLSPFMMTIFPLVWITRHLAMLRPGYTPNDTQQNSDLSTKELQIIPGINDVLTYLLGRESRSIQNRRNLPVGTSLIAIARKGTA